MECPAPDSRELRRGRGSRPACGHDLFLTPMAARLIIGGGPGRVAFAVCVVLNSIFMIQDRGLVGFGRYNWVPVENVLVTVARG